MASGKLLLQCDPPVRDLLCTAIREYAVAAYPPGGSECAQVARYTLTELAAEIEAGITAASGSVQVSRRPRAMVKAALEYYFDRQDQVSPHGSVRQRALLGSLLAGEPVTVLEFRLACKADAGKTVAT